MSSHLKQNQFCHLSAFIRLCCPGMRWTTKLVMHPFKLLLYWDKWMKLNLYLGLFCWCFWLVKPWSFSLWWLVGKACLSVFFCLVCVFECVVCCLCSRGFLKFACLAFAVWAVGSLLSLASAITSRCQIHSIVGGVKVANKISGKQKLRVLVFLWYTLHWDSLDYVQNS